MYNGLLSGDIIKFEKDNKEYELHIKESVRGINIPVTINYFDNKWSAKYQNEDEELIVLKVYKVIADYTKNNKKR